MQIGLSNLGLTGSRRVLLPPTTNMVAWFRKGVGITSSGGLVSAWADQSGNGRNYTQATGSAQPTLQAGGTILFDGTSDFIKTAGFTLNQPWTRYLRIKQVSWTSGEYFCDGASINTGAIFQSGSTPNIVMFAGAVGPSSTALAVGAWGSVAAVFNTASSVIQVGGTTSGTANVGVTNPGGLTLGGTSSGTALSNIEVAEEIVYSGAHDAGTRANIIAYLNTLT